MGQIHIYTGDGKGKTTAAIGLSVRAAGAGWQIFFGQFLKSADYSEHKALARWAEQITVQTFGTGRLIRDSPSRKDVELAQKGLVRAEEAITSQKFQLVILDEILVAALMNLVKESDIIHLIRRLPEPVELVLTGRGATAALVKEADLVTEMKEVKHYYHKGIQAREGIER